MKTYGKVYTTRQEKINDFLIGYFGCLILNGLYGAVIWAVSTAFTSNGTAYNTLVSGLAVVALLLPFFINAFAMVILLFTRVWMALGVLAVFATFFVLVLCASLVFATVCFGYIVNYH